MPRSIDRTFHSQIRRGKRTSLVRRRNSARRRRSRTCSTPPSSSPPDLIADLPPEIALTVLSNLNATDLCLAACVWQKLATDEILWQGLCREQWPEATVYKTGVKETLPPTRDGIRGYRRVYLQLDEGTLTFNSDPHRVIA